MFLLLCYKTILIDIHETYQKQTWRNRCRILTANGILDLSIPIKKNNKRPASIQYIETSNHLPWRRNHWRSISSAYSKAPFFIYYADMIEAHYHSGLSETLLEWNDKLINGIITELGLNCHLKHTNFYIRFPYGEIDFRQGLTPKQPWKGIDWPEYYQVFGDRHGFTPDLSILDLLFNLGPDARNYLEDCAQQYKSQFISG